MPVNWLQIARFVMATKTKNISCDLRTSFSLQLGIDFNHISTGRKISVNTCGGVLHFPANESMKKLESMKEEFIFCILNGKVFEISSSLRMS